MSYNTSSQTYYMDALGRAHTAPQASTPREINNTVLGRVFSYLRQKISVLINKIVSIFKRIFAMERSQQDRNINDRTNVFYADSNGQIHSHTEPKLTKTIYVDDQGKSYISL